MSLKLNIKVKRLREKQCKVKEEVVKAKQRPYEDLCDRMDIEEGEKAFHRLVDECPEKKSYGGWSTQHRIRV